MVDGGDTFALVSFFPKKRSCMRRDVRGGARASSFDRGIVSDCLVGIRGDNHRFGDSLDNWNLGLNCFVFCGYVCGGS